jgi:putative Mg2+ transporter-C (MgtC) family protein
MNPIHWLSTETLGQTGVQLGELTLALLLSSLIGLEREIRMKSAGLRTHTLVGVAAALLVLVSKYGFGDVIVQNQIVLDPSRIAAQIVSGIGFIGGGLIFVQRDVVRGLTTAPCELVIHYLPGQGTVREILKLCTGRAFSVNDVTARDDASTNTEKHAIQLRLRGRGDLDSLLVAIGDLRGVISVRRASTADPKG